MGRPVLGRGNGLGIFFWDVEIYVDFSYQNRFKMGALGDPFLAHFFDFSCTAQGLEWLRLFGSIFEPSPKGKSRCFVKDIL